MEPNGDAMLAKMQEAAKLAPWALNMERGPADAVRYFKLPRPDVVRAAMAHSPFDPTYLSTLLQISPADLSQAQPQRDQGANK